MRIVILGNGALGCTLGGYLARAGHTVSIVARPERLAELRGRPVRVSGLADFEAPVDWVAAGGVPDADVMMVTPLRDGMNLVALEYVATRSENRGALILSEFAGAAERLTDAFIVNPYDLDALAETLHGAVMMDPAEQSRRMARLRRAVGRWDVHAWARQNIEAIDG